jgi:YHS domain-containing protein
MKRAMQKRLIGTTLATFVASAAFMPAGVTAEPTAAPVPVQQSASGGAAINTVCPVSGDKVGGMGKPVSVEYEGKKVALCCKQCKKDFDKEPAKYVALAEKNEGEGSGHH